MTGERLIDALNSFEQTERGIVAFGMAGDTEHAIELIRMRKQMVMEFSLLGQALEADADLAERAMEKAGILRLFAAFRTANALNTAEWPAVRVRDNVAQFRIAARSVGTASHAFWTVAAALRP